MKWSNALFLIGIVIIIPSINYIVDKINEPSDSEKAKTLIRNYLYRYDCNALWPGELYKYDPFGGEVYEEFSDLQIDYKKGNPSAVLLHYQDTVDSVKYWELKAQAECMGKGTNDLRFFKLTFIFNKSLTRVLGVRKNK